jgi:hypothetical protein
MTPNHHGSKVISRQQGLRRSSDLAVELPDTLLGTEVTEKGQRVTGRGVVDQDSAAYHWTYES